MVSNNYIYLILIIVFQPVIFHVTNNRDFEIQTDHLISARQPDLLIVNEKKKKKKEKKNLPNSGLCRFDWPLGETERKWKER